MLHHEVSALRVGRAPPTSRGRRGRGPLARAANAIYRLASCDISRREARGCADCGGCWRPTGTTGCSRRRTWCPRWATICSASVWSTSSTTSPGPPSPRPGCSSSPCSRRRCSPRRPASWSTGGTAAVPSRPARSCRSRSRRRCCSSPMTAGSGCCTSWRVPRRWSSRLSFPAEQALVPHLVPADDLVAQNAVNGQAANIARLVGGSLGGVTAAWGGLPALAVVDAVTFADRGRPGLRHPPAARARTSRPGRRVGAARALVDPVARRSASRDGAAAPSRCCWS